MSKTPSLGTLRRVLGEMFDARFQGVEAARFARTQGYVDGYMRALEEAGLASSRELLAVVNEERCAAARRADSQVLVVPARRPVPHFA